MRNYIFTIAMGLLVPVGIIIALSADTPTGIWLAVALSIVGALGVVLGLVRTNEQSKSATKREKPEN